MISFDPSVTASGNINSTCGTHMFPYGAAISVLAFVFIFAFEPFVIWKIRQFWVKLIFTNGLCKAFDERRSVLKRLPKMSYTNPNHDCEIFKTLVFLGLPTFKTLKSETLKALEKGCCAWLCAQHPLTTTSTHNFLRTSIAINVGTKRLSTRNCFRHHSSLQSYQDIYFFIPILKVLQKLNLPQKILVIYTSAAYDIPVSLNSQAFRFRVLKSQILCILIVNHISTSEKGTTRSAATHQSWTHVDKCDAERLISSSPLLRCDDLHSLHLQSFPLRTAHVAPSKF